MREQIPYPREIVQRERESEIHDRARGLKVELHQTGRVDNWVGGDQGAVVEVQDWIWGMDEDDFVFLAATGVEEGEEGREC